MLRCGKVEVSGGFLLIAAALFYLDDQGIFLWAMLACALHELGHYVAAVLMGAKVLRLRLSAVGGELKLSAEHQLSYGMELIAVLAGPGTNIAVAFLSATAAQRGWETLYLFAGLNLAIGSFNLLPANPLDGGHAIKLMLSLLWSPEAAEGMVRVLACITALLMAAAGVFQLWKTRYNFTLLVVSVWILFAVFRPERQSL